MNTQHRLPIENWSDMSLLKLASAPGIHNRDPQRGTSEVTDWLRMVAISGAMIGVAAASPAPAQTQSDQPAVVAQRIGKSVIADTLFRLEPETANGMQQGFYPVATGTDDVGKYVVLAADIRCVKPCVGTVIDLRYAVSPGDLRILLDGRQIFRKRITKTVEPRELDYGVVDAPIAKANLLGNGGSRLTIVFKPARGPGFVMPGITLANRSGAQDIVSLAPAGKPDADKASRFLRIGASSAKQLRGVLEQLEREPPGPNWQLVAPVTALGNPDPLDVSDWRYFSGAMLSAMLSAGDRFDRPELPAYVGSHVSFFLSNIEKVRAEREAKHQLDGPFAHYFRFTLLDDVGPQSAALAEWNARQPSGRRDPRIEANTAAAIKAILAVPRLADGTMARITPSRLTVWADDLYMGPASLARIATVLNRPDLLDEAARQALLFDKHLRDAPSGLYYHGWHDAAGRHSSSKWARANGWTMLAKLQILKALPAEHRDRAALLRAFANHAHALAGVQSSDGRWHQVLDNPGTYLETSASAMFVAAMAEGVTRGWLASADFDRTIACGWQAVARQVRPDGRVEGIVVGTPILSDDGEYQRQKTRLNDPRGVPAVLFASVAVADWQSRGSASQGCN